MPLYDFCCINGHVTERRAGYDQSVLTCHCGDEARRSPVNRLGGVNGFAITPMNQRPFPMGRFIEAQHEMVDQAKRFGAEAPDVVAIAKREAAQIQKHAPELVTGT